MTFLGKHTVAEVKELLAQKKSDMQHLAQAFIDYEPKWKEKAADAAADFRKDLTDLLMRWRQTVADVETTIKGEEPNTVAELQWTGILKTLQRTPGAFQKGDFPDLIDRLAKEGVTYDAPVIQPTAQDWDLDHYKAADAATKTIEKTAKKSAITLGIAGGIAGIIAIVILSRRV
jgi:hypothetical protein